MTLDAPVQKRPAAEADWGPRGTVGVSFAAALAFEDVHCRLGDREVLRGVEFALKPGEIVCLLGESGSGKSTILRSAAGIQSIHGGRITINDETVSAPGVTLAPEKRGTGLMFQDFALFPHMDALTNVMFGLRGWPRREALTQARQALKRVGLADREGDYPSRLSGGQQQRLALARAVAPRPGILMMDEPFSSLDARLRQSVRAETLAVLRETGATCLIVTHDPEEAMLLGDRVALLRDGVICQIDTAQNIYNEPVDLSAARFLAHLTEVPGIVKAGVIDTPLGRVPAPGRPDGSAVIVGLRAVGSLTLSPEGPGTPGRIVTRRDALGVDILEIAIEGIDVRVRVRRPFDDTLRVGQDVFLHLDPVRVLVFDAN